MVKYLTNGDKSNIFSNLSKVSMVNQIAQSLESICEGNKKIVDEGKNDDDIEIIENEEDEHEFNPPAHISLQEKLEMAISKTTIKRFSQNKSKTDYQKLVRKEISYFEEEGVEKGRKYLELLYNYLLTIPPTSVESERAFSAAGVICTKIRSSMNDETLDAIAFLRAYFIDEKTEKED